MMNGMDLAMNDMNLSTSEIKKAVLYTAFLLYELAESCKDFHKDFHLESYSPICILTNLDT